MGGSDVVPDSGPGDRRGQGAAGSADMSGPAAQHPTAGGGSGGGRHGRYESAPVVPPSPRNVFAITALVLAVLGVLVGLVPSAGVPALALGLLAVLFGLLGLDRVRRRGTAHRGPALAGAGLGAVAVALGVWGLVAVPGAAEQPAEVPPVVGPAEPANPEGGSITARSGDRVTVGDITLVTEPLQDAEPPDGAGPAACSTVAYENTGGAAAPFAPLDWSMRSAQGVITAPVPTGGDGLLGSGDLVPGARTSGRVCFDGTAAGSALLYRGTPSDPSQVSFSG
jgi:hypothetical protein